MADWTKEQYEYLFNFLHPAKLLGMFRAIPADIDSVLWDIPGSEVTALRNRTAAALKTAVDNLLESEAFTDKIRNLPFKKGSTIVCFGDSITDYDLSWAELLREAAGRVHGAETFRILNLAVSGDTSADLIRRFGEVIDAEPDWIITMVGTNDAKYFYEIESGTMVSPAETARNLKLLREIALEKTHSELVWMTPPPVAENKCKNSWLLKLAGNIWYNRNLEPVVKAVRELPDRVVNLFDKFGNPVNDQLFLEDGLHPSIDGEIVILQALLEMISS